MKYRIEDLIETFRQHAKEFEKTNSSDDFNLCEALLLMCQEIQKLKGDEDENRF